MGEKMVTENNEFIRMEEVKKHIITRGENKSIWFVIHDKVYDVTTFLDEHPGGHEPITDNAGTDATEDFEDSWPSIDTREMLKDYFIGDLHPEDRTGIVVPEKHWKSQFKKEPHRYFDVSSGSNEATLGISLLGLWISVFCTYIFLLK